MSKPIRIPAGSGNIVGLCEVKGVVYIACSFAVFVYVEPHWDETLQRAVPETLERIVENT